MSINAGLSRLGQVIDWVCIGMAALVVIGTFGAMIFGNGGAEALFFLILAALIYGFGKGARYIINGFAQP